MERAVGCGHAEIDRALEQDFADLVVGQAVPLCAADVQLELVEASEGDERRQRDAAPRLAIESRPRPDLAPRVARDEVLEVARVLGGTCPVDVRVAEDIAAHAHASLVGVLGHAAILSSTCRSTAAENAS